MVTWLLDSLHNANVFSTSGVARAFPGGRVAHPEGQNEEENEKSLRKSKKNWSKFEEKMRKGNSCPPGTVRLATALVFTFQVSTDCLFIYFFFNVGHSIRESLFFLETQVSHKISHYLKYNEIRLAFNFTYKYKNYIKFKEKLMSTNLEYKFKY